MKRKVKVYIDTSGCYDEEFAEWSNLLFEEFKSGKIIAILIQQNITKSLFP